ncbi:MAG: hypothetical protein DMG65_02145 [Candidatus Angelobacter sp. Gp1-AA117]|nr:MAG: hypothetical protein DMG65_02145 [Candidatus Angelobacter sp. Gp1-AA117]
MKSSARIFIALIVLSGLAVLGNALIHAGSINGVRFVSFAVVACLAARLKVKLPGVTGNMSVNLPFILVAIAEMNAAEALMVACLSTVVQCLPSAQKKFNAVQALFNFSNMALAAGFARLLFLQPALSASVGSRALLLAVAAAGFFLVNTLPVAIVISITEGTNALRTWKGILQLSFPYFVASAGIAGCVLTLHAQIGWQVPVAVLPVMLGIFYSYRRYFAVAASALLAKPVSSVGGTAASASA